ncbi:helix-turn-helix domain-containing protein [Rhodovibrio salinarum]|uniref:helix-turn-helix domain-containing protein n=1 Tax=Rhodovibrio salinarum TaxID=1087 RepID=UPI000481D000|nr:AraC family transcriptional regulator [Rhodovibrio salinarum]
MVTPHAANGPLLDGDFGVCALRPGLLVQYSDAVDLYDLVTRIEQRPGITIQVFLNGSVAATLGGRSLFPDVRQGLVEGAGPRALITTRVRPELLERRGCRGSRVRKVSVTLSQDWLADCGLVGRSPSFDLERFAQVHLAQRNWIPSTGVVALAERILQLSRQPEPFYRLHLESTTIELVAQAFGDLIGRPTGPETGRADPRDLRRMRRIEAYIATADQTALSLDELARFAGTSNRTVQRLFQTIHGISAFEYIRRYNLERAHDSLTREGVSIKEAAHLAGYSGAANFSTAFRRHFGRTPSQVVRQARPQ